MDKITKYLWEPKRNTQDVGSAHIELHDLYTVNLLHSTTEYVEVKGAFRHDVRNSGFVVIGDSETSFPKLNVVIGLCTMGLKFLTSYGLKDTLSSWRWLEVLLDHLSVQKNFRCKVHASIVDLEATRAEMAQFGIMMKSYSEWWTCSD